MASWLKRAEDLFEVVDRRAKLVVTELSDEQSDALSPASNGQVAQVNSTKPKSKEEAKPKAKAQKRASADIPPKSSDDGLEDNIQALESDLKSNEAPVFPPVENDGDLPTTAVVQTSNEQKENIENDGLVRDAPTTEPSTIDLEKHDSNQGSLPATSNVDLVISSSNEEPGSHNTSSLSDEILSTSAGSGTELVNGDDQVDSGCIIEMKDAGDSLRLDQEKQQAATGDIPSPLQNIADALAESPSNEKKQDCRKPSVSQKVQEQLDEAQGLLKSTNSSGKSKEARLARVCAGLSSRLQEYKSENAQLEELLTAERELSKSYEDQLKKLLQELSASKAEVTRIETNMAEALTAKNHEIETLVVSIDTLKKQAALSEGNLASLQANMEALMRNRELTETRMMQAVKEELAAAERRAEEEHAAHNATKKAAMEREVELEHRAIEASTALARVQRVADERTAKAAELEQKVALLEVECASLNQELQDMETRLRRGQKKSPEDTNQLIQMQAWQEEVERAHQAQRDAESKLSSVEAELQKMRVEMASMKRDAEHYSRQEHMELEKRYRELTDLLYYKQTQLETMASEKAAAEFQLEKEIKRLQEAQAEAEKSRISRRASSSWEEDTDMKELEPLPLHQRHLVGATIQLRKAAKILDSGAVKATRFLWRYPRARVGLLFYLVFVHLFLMHLLHRLQEQADNFSAQEIAQSMGLSTPNLP